MTVASHKSFDARPGNPRRIATATNLAVAFLITVSQLWLWFGLPLILRSESLLWAWTLVPAVLLTTTFWSLLHEAFHGNLLPNPRANAFVGRALAVQLGASFRVLRFGHLMHHRFNRTALDSPDLASPDERRNPVTWVTYYVRLTIGLFLAEVLGTWSSLLPRPIADRIVNRLFGKSDHAGRSMLRSARQQLLSADSLREIRIDAVACLVVLGVSLVLYGALWPLLLLALAARGFMISFFDNAYHYGAASDDVISGMNLALPRWAERAILNFNLHGVHHQAPSLPWHLMPEQFRSEGMAYDDGYVRAAAKQLLGPVARQ